MRLLLLACAVAGIGWSIAEDAQKPLGLAGTSIISTNTHTPKHGRKLKGRFLQITDIHPDPFYDAYSSTETGSFCHRGHGAAGYYGAETSDCDSPLTLVNATFAWIAEHLAHDIDFVVWTGDSARHDNDEEIPRTEAQVLGQNRMLVNKFKEVFGWNNDDDDGGGRGGGREGRGGPFRIPIVPTFGNNDILPHNIFVKGPNRWTKNYLTDVWRDIVPEAQKHAFERGGWFFVEVIPNKLAVFSLNTIYFFDSNSAVDGCASPTEPGFEHLEWLRIQLQFLRDRGMKAILSGHVPPARNEDKVGWDETCWQKYTIWLQQYRDVIVGSVYGHMNIEHFVLQDFKDIDYDRAAGIKHPKSASFADGDGNVNVMLNDAGYLHGLRRMWSKLPLAPETLGWDGLEDSDGRSSADERNYYEQIGGRYAERFAVSHIAASVVPNYFPALRVYEYDISGLEDLVVSPTDALSEPSPELWYNDDEDGLDTQDSLPTSTSPEDLKKCSFLSNALSLFTSTITRKKKKSHLIIPHPPSKHAPPGPAYSPQPLSWLGYTVYHANLTHINNDFNLTDPNSTTTQSSSAEQNASSSTTYTSIDPLSHYPTTPFDIHPLRWNGGKHAGRHPRHQKPQPLNFTFELEYDTREQEDAYGLGNRSVVRAWLELATRMGEFRPRKVREVGVVGEEEDVDVDGDGDVDVDISGAREDDEDEDEHGWVMVDVEDLERTEDDVETEKKKHNKKKHGDSGGKGKDKKRRKRLVERTWLTFASRAVVGTLTKEELVEKFGTE